MPTAPLHTPGRLVVDDADDVALARLLAEGAVVAHGFGNMYALTARGDADAVLRLNALKGRPAGQVGSLTVPSGEELSAFDLGALPSGLPAWVAAEVVAALTDLGPIGLRGPAAGHVPAHLTADADGVTTTQVILPGARCPSNAFLAAATAAVAPVPLVITSANRSRHVTGATEEPAHWRAAELRADLGDLPGLVVLEHADEAVARARFPEHEPMSTTILGLHRVEVRAGVVRVPVERHGSLHVDRVREVLATFGLGVVVAPSARVRLTARAYGRQPV